MSSATKVARGLLLVGRIDLQKLEDRITEGNIHVFDVIEMLVLVATNIHVIEIFL